MILKSQALSRNKESPIDNRYEQSQSEADGTAAFSGKKPYWKGKEYKHYTGKGYGKFFVKFELGNLQSSVDDFLLFSSAYFIQETV
jgi:hypothetical protein